MLQLAQQICQYEMDTIQAALADDDATAQPRQPLCATAYSSTAPIHLGDPASRAINHWIGLTQVMFKGSVQMAMAMHRCALDAMEQLREQTSRVTPVFPGISPGIPGYMLSALESSMGHTMAILDESQGFAVDAANAVLPAAHERVTDGAGQPSKSGARAKSKGRLLWKTEP